MTISLNDQEIFGWVGNTIFITALIMQIFHTYRIKETKDMSYFLSGLWIIGNSMYTSFGYLDKSDSLFYGSLISLVLSITQISQKIYYDNYYTRSLYVQIGDNI